jgi:spore maturation protein SpmB
MEEVKMGKKYKRTKYFIHPSSQGAYIALSILPALIMSLYFTYFLISSGELVLKASPNSAGNQECRHGYS